MAGNSIQTVKIKGDGLRKEFPCAADITPGMLVEMYKATVLKVRAHSTAGGRATKMIALENVLVGRDLNTAYASPDTVQVEVLPPGAEVNMLVANGAPAIAMGDLVESAGDGTVRKRIVNPAAITDSTGGTGSATFAAITAGSSYAQADLTALKNIASETATLFNALASVTGGVVGTAMEDCDNSGGSVPVRLRVELV